MFGFEALMELEIPLNGSNRMIALPLSVLVPYWRILFLSKYLMSQS